MVEILKQNQYVPMSVAQQVAIIFAGVNGYMDNVDLAKIGDYESGLMDYLSANNQEVLDSISNAGKIFSISDTPYLELVVALRG